MKAHFYFTVDLGQSTTCVLQVTTSSTPIQAGMAGRPIDPQSATVAPTLPTRDLRWLVRLLYSFVLIRFRPPPPRRLAAEAPTSKVELGYPSRPQRSGLLPVTTAAAPCPASTSRSRAWRSGYLQMCKVLPLTHQYEQLTSQRNTA